MNDHTITVRMKNGKANRYRFVLYRVDLRDEEGRPVQLSILREDDVVNLAGPGPHDFITGYVFEEELPV